MIEVRVETKNCATCGEDKPEADWLPPHWRGRERRCAKCFRAYILQKASTLRELFRNLHAFRAFYEAENVDTITGPDGIDYCLWDVEYLYGQVKHLSPRQSQAIELCLVNNVKEKDAARIMGVSETNPVMMYAANGLKKICEMAESGELPRFREGVAA